MRSEAGSVALEREIGSGPVLEVGGRDRVETAVGGWVARAGRWWLEHWLLFGEVVGVPWR